MSKETGVSSTTVLLFIFIILKLTGNIACSWWWVLSPLWILPAIGIIIIAIVFIIAFIGSIK